MKATLLRIVSHPYFWFAVTFGFTVISLVAMTAKPSGGFYRR